MKRFFDRIREKSLDASQPPILIVALGDSVTQGIMELGRLDSETVYHRRFQRQMERVYPLTTFSTINAGVNGNTVRQAIERVSRDVIPYRPDLLLIAFGLNDCGGGLEALPDFENGLLEMIAIVRAQSESDIVLITPPFMAGKPTKYIHSKHESMAERIFQLQNEGILSTYAESIRQIAHRTGCVLADVHAEWGRLKASGVDTDEWLCNGLNHPGNEGHHLAAVILFETVFALRKTL